jgi:signal transduction histidine kinase
MADGSSLTDFFSTLFFPVILLARQDGRILHASTSGKRAFHNAVLEGYFALFAPEKPVPFIVALSSLCLDKTQSPLPSPQTSWFALQEGYARASLLPGDNSTLLLEFFTADENLQGFPIQTTNDRVSRDFLTQHNEQEQLRFFQAVSRAVNSSLILEDIFEALGEALYEFIPYQEAVIVILDESQNGIKTLVRLAADGSLELSGEHHSFAGYEPLMDRVLRDPRSARLDEQQSRSGLFTDITRPTLLVPLINKGVVIGLLALSAPDHPMGGASSPFTAWQEILLSEVSAQLAVAVENARLYWQTQSQAGREFLINQLTRSVRQSLEIDVILATAARELGKVMGVSRCFICYFPPQASEQKVFAYQMANVASLSIHSPEALPEHDIFQRRQQNRYNPFILNDVRDCPSDWIGAKELATAQLKSLAVIPVFIQEMLVGTISLHQCDAYRSWVSEDIALLAAMAEHLGVALNQARLFETLDQRTRDLEQTLNELQQAQLYLIQSEKMAVLGQFVAGIAHEVNTPLGTMMSNNTTLTTCFEQLKPALLAEPSQDKSEEKHQEQERLIHGMDSLLSLNQLAGSRIQEIVRNLRNFARLDESELKTVDLHEGIDSTILLLESSLDKRIQIIRDYSPDLPPLQCFPGLLNQVFMNLIVNASHAIAEILPPVGSPPLTTPLQITIRSEWNEALQTACISVCDTGKGIAPENLKKVFDPGFTTKGVGVGTGLGLALCYRIVEKHGGRISVISEPGQGACFTVRLPLAMPVST